MSMRNPSPQMRYWDYLDYKDMRTTMDAWPNSFDGTDEGDKWRRGDAKARREWYEQVDDFEAAQFHEARVREAMAASWHEWYLGDLTEEFT